MQLPTQPSVHQDEAPQKIEKMKHVVRRIKFESELYLDFGERVAEKAYGQKFLAVFNVERAVPLVH